MLLGGFLHSHPKYTQSVALDARMVLQADPFASLDFARVSFFVREPEEWSTKLACKLPRVRAYVRI